MSCEVNHKDRQEGHLAAEHLQLRGLVVGAISARVSEIDLIMKD